MATAFDEEVIRLLAKIDEVEVETRAGPDAPAHRVTIWVVVDDGIAYVRSVRGARGRWYREATAFPDVVVYAGKQRLPAHVEPISDAATIARVSDAFLRKYVQWPNDARAMVRDEVLETTTSTFSCSPRLRWRTCSPNLRLTFKQPGCSGFRGRKAKSWALTSMVWWKASP